MRRYFNTEGRCRPDIHYMVRLEERLDKIKRMYVDRGKYFVINRGRQYGKTTTLMALAEYLTDEYAVLPMDFQALGTDNFADGPTFVVSFIEYLEEIFSRKDGLKDVICPDAYQGLAALKAQGRKGLDKLFRALSELCRTAAKPVVLMIDEVDSASNNQIFIEFLAQLRRYYLDRESSPTFHSVILAGVYDIKNLKLKIRPEENHQYNSPWNIAARFNIEMSFSAGEIAGMLREYEDEQHTGMDVNRMARYVYDYTSGYPWLVSAICKFLDEEIPDRDGFEDSAAVWSRAGIEEAVKILLKEKLPLFDSMIKQLEIYPDLKNVLGQILYEGKKVPFSPDTQSINMGIMFGFLKEKDGAAIMANRIFEMRMLNMLISEESLGSDAFQHGDRDKNQFIQNGRLDMERVLAKFVEYFHEIYGDNDEKFVEKYGRKFFLLYLKPIINGTGNYYLEAQTRDAGRTDVVVDYRGEQFVVELKIWRGNAYRERGEQQLAEYLDYFGLEKGYMLSFNFNQKKEIGVRHVQAGGRVIVEAVV
ncbi:MAG TPA: 9-O-acetyl-N-acetylneuraminate esterase [Lachnospiraceae bacterium]|nr:9-O-acetyl-N-acetylneuraminate esterase [Lachnospiraceae bacterium]